MGYQLELRHLHYFAVLAEELHFGRAADRLFISQPGLSKQIKHLESILEVKLLERSKRSVRLTSAGHYLNNEIGQLSERIEDIVDRTKLIHSGLKGSLRLGYIGSAMQNIIPNLLKQLDVGFPDVQFDLSEMGNGEQIERLFHESIDLGFVRTDHVPQPLKAQIIFEDTFSLVLPRNHRITSPELDDLSRVAEEKFILFDSSYSQSYYVKVMQIFADAGFSPKVAHHTIHASSIYRLVENGFGISIVPTSLKLGYDLGVKFVELTTISQRASLSAVWNPANRNPVMEHVLSILPKLAQ